MASINLGHLRSAACPFYRDQLLASQTLFCCFQVFSLPHDARFLPLRHLAPHWSIEDLRLPLCQGRFYSNLYVPATAVLSTPLPLIIFLQIMEPALQLDGIGSCPCKLSFLVSVIVLTSLFSLFTAGTMTGFDASGHIAEETKNARYFIVVELYLRSVY